MKIIKRDGKKEPFDSQKIMDAVLKAFLAVDGTITEYAEIKAYNIAEHIEKIAETTSLTIDNIQDYVEKGLMATKRKDVAKAYILYRKQRDMAREKNTDIYKEAANKLFAKNVQNQNANVDEHSFGGRMGEFSETYLKKYALENCMSEMARNNHLNNEIYTHDLGSYAAGMHNCLTLPFDLALANGVKTRQTDIRPANSASTALQLLAVYFQLQSLQQFGGVSVSHLDWSMVPYIRKSFWKHYKNGLKYLHNISSDDIEHMNENGCIEKSSIEDTHMYNYEGARQYALDMTEKEVNQSVEAMYHNLSIWAA